MQGEQLMICTDGQVRTKVENAIKRLQSFEPPEGYYVAFSGGKDSQCIYHLCQMAGVKFDAHYSVTSVDPPELVQFIKRQYPDVIFDLPRYANGERITMWNLIPREGFPPLRTQRYCCKELKEANGEGRIIVTGVRWAESARRKAAHDVASIKGKPKTTEKMAQELGADYSFNKSGALVLNDDNDPARRMVEHCYRTQKVMVNPIVDWETEDVWTFLDKIAKCLIAASTIKALSGSDVLGALLVPMQRKNWKDGRSTRNCISVPLRGCSRRGKKPGKTICIRAIGVPPKK